MYLILWALKCGHRRGITPPSLYWWGGPQRSHRGCPYRGWPYGLAYSAISGGGRGWGGSIVLKGLVYAKFRGWGGGISVKALYTFLRAVRSSYCRGRRGIFTWGLRAVPYAPWAHIRRWRSGAGPWRSSRHGILRLFCDQVSTQGALVFSRAPLLDHCVGIGEQCSKRDGGVYRRSRLGRRKRQPGGWKLS